MVAAAALTAVTVCLLYQLQTTAVALLVMCAGVHSPPTLDQGCSSAWERHDRLALSRLNVNSCGSGLPIPGIP
jgi:hypothetical protein